jgi:tyrosinase
MALSRRSLVKGAAAIPLALWLEELGFAQTTVTRFDCTSTNGKLMLGIYADAVKKMMNPALVKEADPRSWTFQWYLHAVRGNTTKAAEIARIYPSSPPPNNAWKSLANDVWNTCQSHFRGMDPMNFLPWHRMVLIYFEQVIRNVSGKANFTLPYWNYTVGGAQHAVIPPEFRKKGDAKFGSLYVEKRTRGNDGLSIDRPAPQDVINLTAFRQCRYEPSGALGAIAGFCRAVDGGVHGAVHTRTGNSENMAVIPWAAGDPVFWVHHCQIDRLWARWNARGGKNPTDPTWKNQSFTFADGTGKRVTAKIGDVLDLSQVKYTYEVLNDPVPDCDLGKPTPTASIPLKLVTRAAPIQLAATAVRQRLTAPPSPTAQVPLGDRIKNLPAGKRLFLVVRGLQSNIEPGVMYDLYLEVPAAAPGKPSTELYVGSIHFFNAVPVHGMAPPDRPFSFEITDLAKRLNAKGAMATAAELTIVPSGAPSSAAKPVVGEVSIIEQ